MAFTADPVDLEDLLDNAESGRLQLPDFQREWKWEDDRIRELIASVTLGYPIGVVMTLQVGSENAKFAPTLLSGVVSAKAGPPQELLLDGQQRLTSLFQALKSTKPVQTTDARKKRIERWYYLSIDESLDPDGDRDEAVKSVPADRMIRTDFGREVVADFTTRDKEIAAGMFPLNLAFDTIEGTSWLLSYGTTQERAARAKRFNEQVLKNIRSYEVPTILLTRDTPKEAVCTVFEKVNTGGVALDVFELLTATFASDNYKLKDDWTRRRADFHKKPVLRGIGGTDFIQAISLLATWQRRQDFIQAGRAGQAPGVTCKRKDLLKLSLADYRRWADPVSEAMLKSAAFLAEEAIFQAEDVPYRTQLVPLAAIRAALGDDADVHGALQKIRLWYWCGVLGELYGGAVETRFARDLEQMVGWIDGGGLEPGTMSEASFRSARLLTLTSRLSAAYKGIYALLMKHGCQDWVKHQPLNYASFFEYKIDIHHVFPQRWCSGHQIDKARMNSIVNKTALSSTTNRSIGGSAPSEYLPKIESQARISAAELDGILSTHWISPDALRADNFDAYFVKRETELLNLISGAMGKPAYREQHEAATHEAAQYELSPEEAEDEVAEATES
jgi:hypothetical protein